MWSSSPPILRAPKPTQGKRLDIEDSRSTSTPVEGIEGVMTWVLVAGSTGYLGRFAAKELKERGDLGMERRDLAVQCDYLPPDLVRLAGSLGLGIETSQDPASGEEPDA